ncbi:(d)CMP kinase [Spiroplasma endosymbiont of Crioceris asparagi]|uniref:(d)CMP kinase n=1 Tax=Spiroplasma endosymbiont of Crioceris asparagi TaxID=3066286 RepID=UPI0030D39D43
MNKIVIAVDGTAGSGKSSTMEHVAKLINYEIIDSGKIYRAFTKFCVDQNTNFNDQLSILNSLSKFDCYFQNNIVFVNGQNYNEYLFDNEVISNINKITPVPQVREKLTNILSKLATKGIIMIGRDITSVVLPNADLKFYFDTNYKIRAQRRYEQNKKNNIEPNILENIEQQIFDRDESDKNRTVGPLIKTSDAILVDTSIKSKEEIINEIINIIKEKSGE